MQLACRSSLSLYRSVYHNTPADDGFVDTVCLYATAAVRLAGSTYQVPFLDRTRPACFRYVHSTRHLRVLRIDSFLTALALARAGSTQLCVHAHQVRGRQWYAVSTYPRSCATFSMDAHCSGRLGGRTDPFRPLSLSFGPHPRRHDSTCYDVSWRSTALHGGRRQYSTLR